MIYEKYYDMQKEYMGEFSCIYNNSTSKPYMSFILLNCLKGKKNYFINTCNKIINNLTNDNELNIRLNNFVNNNNLKDILGKKNQPHGIFINNMMIESWLYGGQCFAYLNFNEEYLNINNITNEQIIKIVSKIFINNYKNTFLIMENKSCPGYEVAVSQNRINQLKKSCIEDLKSNKDFKLRISNSSISKYLKNINSKNTSKILLQKMYIEDVLTFLYEDNTDDLSYINLYFDLYNIDSSYLCYIPIIEGILQMYITKNFEKNEVYIDAKNKNLRLMMQKDVIQEFNNYNLIHPKLILKANISYKYEETLIKFFQELLKNIKIPITSKEVKQVINILKDNFKRSLVKNAQCITTRTMAAQSSLKSRYEDLFCGIGMYEFLFSIDLNNHTTMEYVINNLNTVLENIFVKKNLIVSFTSNKIEINKINNYISNICKVLNANTYKTKNTLVNFRIKNEGFIISTEQNYINQGYISDQSINNIISRLLCEYLNMNYIFNMARNQIGAYDCSIKVIDNQLFSMYCLSNSKLDIVDKKFCKIIDIIKKSKYENNKIDFLKLNELKRLNYYCDDIGTINYIRKVPKEYEKILINNISEINSQNLKEFSSKVFENIKKENYCVLSNKKDILNNKSRFNCIQYI